MSDKDRTELVDEAVEIFLALRAAPSDRALLRHRDLFLARGGVEREVYDEVARAWGTAAVAGRARPRARRRVAVATIAAAVLAAAVFGPDAYIRVRSDFRSGEAPAHIELSSGDVMHLDARSAIEDESGAETRRINLLQGAAFFDVERDGRPFIVETDHVIVSVLGTSFEVAKSGSATIVGVAEGAVSVEYRGETHEVAAGGRLIASNAAGLQHAQVDPSLIAPWRGDRLIADGLTFEALAEIVERRLPGAVVLMGEDLKQTRITGGFDLNEPMTALRAMAAVMGARVVAAPPAITLIFDPGF
ncbi:MAG: FecR domain-containing protein [Pseudomonadota bacterium]